MADEIDSATDRIIFDTEVGVKGVVERAKKFNPGQPGECDLCGEEFARVVEVEKAGETILSCGRCRDRHGLS